MHRHFEALLLFTLTVFLAHAAAFAPIPTARLPLRGKQDHARGSSVRSAKTFPRCQGAVGSASVIRERVLKSKEVCGRIPCMNSTFFGDQLEPHANRGAHKRHAATCCVCGLPLSEWWMGSHVRLIATNPSPTTALCKSVDFFRALALALGALNHTDRRTGRTPPGHFPKVESQQGIRLIITHPPALLSSLSLSLSLSLCLSLSL